MIRLKLYIAAFALVGAAFGRVSGAVVVNEVLANEPGSNTTLEWVELYNAGQVSANLAIYFLNVSGYSVPLSGTIEAGAYLIVCRRLVGSGGTPGFESVWGNNTGVWGDTSSESSLAVVEATFSLVNSADTVMLIRAGLDTSLFTWSESGADGRSWERVQPTLNEIRQSVDYSGSTPGFVNSVTPLPNDLAVDAVCVNHTTLGAEISLTVTNTGVNSAMDKRLLICAMNPAMPDSLGEILDSVTIPVLYGGFSTDIVRDVHLSGVYQYLIASLDADDRVRNNRRAFVAPGEDYPPLLLTELMTDPQLPLTSEWIELYCPLESPFYVQSWMLADAADTALLASDPFTVSAGQYLVLAADTSAFRQYYPDFDGRLTQPPRWLTLNDGGDVVSLIDRYGILADRFSYGSSYDNNYTWARTSDGGRAEWGRSVVSGGSPGRANDVVIEPHDERLSLTIEPRVFSPDGDGYQDVTEITIEAPEAVDYTLKIYDREGRPVRTLADNAALVRRSYEWDGLSDSGRRLPIGIYICYLEASGVEAVKKTVVIAR